MRRGPLCLASQKHATQGYGHLRAGGRKSGREGLGKRGEICLSSPSKSLDFLVLASAVHQKLLQMPLYPVRGLLSSPGIQQAPLIHNTSKVDHLDYRRETAESPTETATSST